MTGAQAGQVVRGLERLFDGGSVVGVSEVQLLERFVARRDAAAFEALVARHGAMVLGVCRQWLRNSHDVEDAFQATFLVLVRKAPSLRDRELLGNWLYGVAYRVAMRARCDAARRRAREEPGAPDVADGRSLENRDPCTWLHEEVQRLPEKYRAPIVLCYLEGLTHEQAAEQLAWPLGTVKGRISRARELLKSRLARRGIVPSFGSLLVLLSRDAQAAVRPALVDRTVSAGCAAAGGALAAGTISAQAAALTKGVCHAMFLSKLKVAAASLALVAFVTTGAAVIADPSGQPPSDPGPPGVQTKTTTTTNASQPRLQTPPPIPKDAALEVARHALAAMEASSKQGRDVGPDQIHTWSLRLLDAEQAVARTQAERVKAAEAHLARMKNALEQASKGYEHGQRPLLSLLESQYRFAQAAERLASANAPESPRASAPATAPPRQIQSGGSMAKFMEAQKRATGGAGAGIAGGGGGGLAGARGPDAFSGGGGLGVDEALEEHQARMSLARMAAGVEARESSPESQATRKKLEERVDMSFSNGVPLSDVLKYIKSATTADGDNGIPIYVDPKGLQDANATLDGEIRMDLDGIPLRTTLRLALKQHGLAYCVKDGLVIISSVEGICRELEEAVSGMTGELAKPEREPRPAQRPAP